jgi:hypothetical protein
MGTHKIEFSAAEAARLTAEAIQDMASWAERTKESALESFKSGIESDDSWRTRYGKDGIFKSEVIGRILQVFADSSKFNQIYQAAQISVTIQDAQEAQNNG